MSSEFHHCLAAKSSEKRLDGFLDRLRAGKYEIIVLIPSEFLSTSPFRSSSEAADRTAWHSNEVLIILTMARRSGRGLESTNALLNDRGLGTAGADKTGHESRQSKAALEGQMPT